jgi:hypothetical protein
MKSNSSLARGSGSVTPARAGTTENSRQKRISARKKVPLRRGFQWSFRVRHAIGNFDWLVRMTFLGVSLALVLHPRLENQLFIAAQFSYRGNAHRLIALHWSKRVEQFASKRLSSSTQ